jgi:hypothetical protein
MITINVIKVNEVEYLTGKIGKRRLLSRILKDLRDVLLDAAKSTAIQLLS